MLLDHKLKDVNKRLLFHIHTYYSCDSISKPSSVLSKAVSLKADAIAITDHNTLDGSRAVQELTVHSTQFRNISVIIGAEYSTDCGDIIGLFLKQDIYTQKASEVVESIKAQGGIVVLPHPYYHHSLNNTLISGCDIIETYNSRCSARDNTRAMQLALANRKPKIGGSDAHFISEIGLTSNRYAQSTVLQASTFTETEFAIESQPTSRAMMRLSQAIKAAKSRKVRRFIIQLAKAGVDFVRHDSL
jgi:predicted metal-dependent phosphoesterase TrpH